MVDVRSGGGIHGTANQRAGFERFGVAGEVGDNHLHDFVWQATG